MYHESPHQVATPRGSGQAYDVTMKVKRLNPKNLCFSMTKRRAHQPTRTEVPKSLFHAFAA